MNDARFRVAAPIRDPQRQIVLLGARQIVAEAAERQRDLASNGGARPDIIERVQQIGRPIRLEKGIPTFAGRADLVFVDVDEVGVGRSRRLRGDFGERQRREAIARR
jgi:hypothetical protein